MAERAGRTRAVFLSRLAGLQSTQAAQLALDRDAGVACGAAAQCGDDMAQHTRMRFVLGQRIAADGQVEVAIKLCRRQHPARVP